MSGRLAGLYIHVPFCARVCPYCDFAVRTGGRERRRAYVDHLLREIELRSDWSLPLDTIYFGGGTPSSLEADDLARILDTVRRRLPVDSRTWTFLEANPEDVTAASAAAWNRLGVRTLSIGAQSLDPAALEFLGRQHGVQGVRRSVALARDAGFDTVSIDLIYGLPGQSSDGWRADMDRAIALGPDHISCYQLTIHERTRFRLLEKRGRLTQMPTDEQAEMFRLTHRHLADAGYLGYEVSQFATGAEHRSRHNVKYWDHTPYLGLGPAAHSHLDDRRWWNVRRTDPWQETVARGIAPVEGGERLSREAMALEALMTGLRTYEGVELQWFESRWDVGLIGRNGALIAELEAQGLVSLRRGRLVPTLDGLAVADALAARFVLS